MLPKVTEALARFGYNATDSKELLDSNPEDFNEVKGRFKRTIEGLYRPGDEKPSEDFVKASAPCCCLSRY